MKKLAGIVLSCLVFILAGCVTAATPTATSIPPTAKDAIVVYHRSGGIAGFDETWTIYGDGRIDHTGRGAGQSGQLPTDRLNSLIVLIRSIDLKSIKDSYVGENTCCDRFIYEITITLDGQTKSIKTIDAAEGEPQALTQLLAGITATVK